MLQFSFDFQKSIEMSGLFLALADGRMHNVRLMKLLYMADRKCLEAEARIITGDKFFAMRKGPVLSTIHDLIRGKNYQSSIWQHYLRTDGHDVVVDNDPGVGELCRFEKEIIHNVYHGTKDSDVVQLTHAFPEWKKYENLISDHSTKNSYPILIEDILEGLGRLELLGEVKEQIATAQYYKKLFGK